MFLSSLFRSLPLSSRSRSRRNSARLAVETLEARLVPAGRISGVVFDDTTGDGVRTGNAGINGIKVFIDDDEDDIFDAGERSTTTATVNGVAGFYEFTGLSTGEFPIRCVLTDTIQLNANT